MDGNKMALLDWSCQAKRVFASSEKRPQLRLGKRRIDSTLDPLQTVILTL